MEWEPYCSFTLLISRATVSSPSSQEMGSNLPLPRSPTLFKGWVRRSGAYTTSLCERPLGQARRPGRGPSSVVIRLMLPSEICTFRRHLAPQSREQVEVTIFSWGMQEHIPYPTRKRKLSAPKTARREYAGRQRRPLMGQGFHGKKQVRIQPLPLSTETLAH